MDESENNPGEIEFIKGLEKTGSVSKNHHLLKFKDEYYLHTHRSLFDNSFMMYSLFLGEERPCWDYC